jgi:sucrose phosphorylase
MRKISNTVQLITYADTLGSNLKDLKSVLDEDLHDIVTGVHILPFHPSSADRGFAPLTHFEIDPAFGNWNDMRAITARYDVTCDLIVNHISSQSAIFQNYLKYDKKSPYAGYFITPSKFSRRIFPYRTRTYPFLERVERIINKMRKHDKVFHTHGVRHGVLRKIYRPRAGSPFVEFTFANGKTRHLWCTFSPDQVDMDVMNPEVRALFEQIISHHARNGIRVLRLDAVGYAVKRRGTDSFNIPETYKFITWLADTAHKYNINILPEVHSHYKEQQTLATTPGVDFVYDSQLPLLVLHTLFAHNTDAIKNWYSIRPQNMVTTLDTHDGLPIPDVEDLITPQDLEFTVDQIRAHGGRDAMRAVDANSTKQKLYQMDVTYYSACGENDDAYIAARAMQFFMPGIPQVYYVGLLAGRNDVVRADETGVGRDINRHGYTREEIATALQQPVVQRLFQLIKLRNTHPAFGGTCELVPTASHVLILRWTRDHHFCEATIDCQNYTTTIRMSDAANGETITQKF